MIDLFRDITDACRIAVPDAHRQPIALVGAGAIMDVAHLPAYTAAGLPIAGLTDVDRARAEDVAARHGVPRVYADLDELLADDTARVVDVAVPMPAQPDIVRRALESGRHVLGQKPFAPDPATGAALADLADERGLVLAVNQQLRFDEGMAAAHAMVERGWIGEVTALSVTVDIRTDFGDWPWMLGTDRLEIANHSIHYHDLVRWFLGEPESVFCVGGRRPGQNAAGETRTVTTCTYASGATAVVHANHENLWGDGSATVRIDGSRGAVRGTLGLLHDYPHGRPDTLEVFSTVVPTDGWVPYPVTSRWIPDAFLGPMADVLAAAATGSTPRTAARDNVGTLRVVEALYAAIRSGQVQQLGRAS